MQENVVQVADGRNPGPFVVLLGIVFVLSIGAFFILNSYNFDVGYGVGQNALNYRGVSNSGVLQPHDCRPINAPNGFACECTAVFCDNQTLDVVYCYDSDGVQTGGCRVNYDGPSGSAKPTGCDCW